MARLMHLNPDRKFEWKIVEIVLLIMSSLQVFGRNCCFPNENLAVHMKTAIFALVYNA